MALSDWLNPATPQPSFLTSRAAGVVVPEFYRAATEARKSSLALAGQEQSLRFNEEQNQRAREAEERRKAEEAAVAAVMPRLTSLDPRSPNYFRDLSSVLAEPGASNALASQQARAFLDIASGARGETLRQQDIDKEEQLRREQESRNTATQIAKEERDAARNSLEGVEGLARKYAEELEDDDFLTKFAPEINKVREAQKTKPAEVPALLTNLTETLTRERGQRAVKNELLGYGLSVAEVEKLKENGKFGDTAKSRLGELKRSLTNNQLLAAQIDVLDADIKAAETRPSEQQRLIEERRELVRRFSSSGSLARPDVGARYLMPQTGGAPAAARGESKF
jgi:hypothetical protein